MSDFEKIVGAVIILFTLSHLIDQYYNKTETPGTIKLNDSVSNDSVSLEKKIKSVKFDLSSVEEELKTQVKQQVNDFAEKELAETERTGVMSPELVNIMTNELEGVGGGYTGGYDPYNPMEFSFSAKDDQIRYADLPEFVNMTEKRYTKKPEQKQPAKPKKNYSVDGMDYYNPCSNDQFGFVSANNITCGNYASF